MRSILTNIVNKYLISSILFLFLFSCTSITNYFDNNNKQQANDKALTQVQIPEFMSPISKPSFIADIENEKLVTLNTSEDTPIKSVLEELARISGLDIDISPNISGSVIINANNKPVSEVIERICEISNIRYKIKNNTIIFSKDSPYIKHYKVNFIIDEAIWGEVEKGIDQILSTATRDVSVNSSLPSALDVVDGENENQEDNKPEYSIFVNKIAGMITIFANDRMQELASSYLEEVEKQSSIQVLIEAKVVEVNLTEEYNSGIDWTFFQKGNVDTESNPVYNNIKLDLANSLSAFAIQDITAAIDILQTFGEAKTIQSPRVTTLNNQKAKLDFTSKLVYFEIESTAVSSTGDSDNVTSSSNATKKEEDVGVVLEITPSIHLRNRTIKLKLNPSISIESGWVADPTNTENKIPVIQERSIETVMSLKSGSTLVMGGLMKDSINQNSTGFPILSKIPILNYFFKRDSENKTKVETVIFIKATILDTQHLDKKDQDFLNNAVVNF